MLINLEGVCNYLFAAYKDLQTPSEPYKDLQTPSEPYFLNKGPIALSNLKHPSRLRTFFQPPETSSWIWWHSKICIYSSIMQLKKY